MTLIFIFFVPCFVHLSFLYVCSLLRDVHSSEKCFFRRSSFSTFSQFIYQRLLHTVARCFWRQFCKQTLPSFLSDFCVTRHLLRFLVALVQHVLHPPSSQSWTAQLLPAFQAISILRAWGLIDKLQKGKANMTNARKYPTMFFVDVAGCCLIQGIFAPRAGSCRATLMFAHVPLFFSWPCKRQSLML